MTETKNNISTGGTIISAVKANPNGSSSVRSGNIKPALVKPYSLFSDFDIHLFREGRHYRLWEKLGSHLVKVKGKKGVYFAVWAPNAREVSVIGDFNSWTGGDHLLHPRLDSSGIWEGFIPGLDKGTVYKYQIVSNNGGQILEKGDLYARQWEHPPRTASVVWDGDHDWKDKRWMKSRGKKNSLDAPISVYEVHLGSWKRKVEDGFRSYTYREMGRRIGSLCERPWIHPCRVHAFDGIPF